MRVIWITGNVMGRSVGEVNKEIEQRLQGLEIQPGWAIEYGGLAKMMSENFKSLALILVLALFLAYVILAIQFESFMWPFIILLRVPLSLVGISLALFVTNTPVGITVVIGFIILAGIEIVHGVVLLTFIQQLMEQGMVLKEAVVKGAMLRLRPIIMTMSVGVFGLLPLALGIGEGTEMLKPMAIGVIGGLIFSMFLTFYFIPVIFVMVNERKRAI
jgi:HAE1 family hydrophobic/amphiphilic exporter-1